MNDFIQKVPDYKSYIKPISKSSIKLKNEYNDDLPF